MAHALFTAAGQLRMLVPTSTLSVLTLTGYRALPLAAPLGACKQQHMTCSQQVCWFVSLFTMLLPLCIVGGDWSITRLHLLALLVSML